MRVGRLECFAGISGDMFLGALVGAGVPFELLARAASALNLGAELRLTKVSRSGIEAAKVDVMLDGRVAESGIGEESGSHAHHHSKHHAHGPHSHTRGMRAHIHGRSLGEIRSILDRAALSEGVRSLARHAFDLLGEAEARIHGVPLEQIHFHEAGTIDAIVDVTCWAAGIDSLAVEQWYASPVNVGSGWVDCSHGRFPVPAPATAELLKAIPTYAEGPAMEMTTPTGAALLCALHCRFDSPGGFRAQVIGYGAGSRDPEGFPNVLRLTLGELADVEDESSFSRKGLGWNEERVAVLECAIDDQSPQLVAHAAQSALEAGALDAMSVPAVMKKGRMGTLLIVLTRPDRATSMAELLFRETSTLGIRIREDTRVTLDREIVLVQTEFGSIQVKVGGRRGEEKNAAPEFEDCRAAAARCGVAVKDVMRAALAGWHEKSRERSLPAEESHA